MDAHHFDALARGLVTAGSRRGLLGVLATLPLVGGLAALLDPEDADARGRRHRRRVKRHRHGKGRRRKHHKKCKAHSHAKTCAGQCGTVKNTCKKTVDCGSCACDPPCAICQTCDASSGQCTNLANGTACGEGLHCQDGQCVCDVTSCADGCCQGGQCHVDDDDACGTGGGSCTSCTPPETCGGGDPGTPGVCGCTPVDPCTGSVCGTVTNNCGQSIDCGPCPPPEITSFTATPTTIDRGATPPETSTLAWTTTNATTCAIDNGVGSVTCNGSTSVGPSATTIYTLSASGTGGGPVTAQATVAVEYCHAITAQSGTCPSGATEFCESVPIDATSSAHAQDACNACAGGGCVSIIGPIGGSAWFKSSVGDFFYSNGAGPVPACVYTDQAGDITDIAGCFVSRWAP